MSINFQSKNIIPSVFCLLLSLAGSASSREEQISIPKQDKQNRISIVIDDLGDNSIVAKKLLALPGTMTVAILPHTPHAKLISKLATEHGHDIIMHLPMEAFTRPDLLGPGALMSSMDEQAFDTVFKNNLKSIPNVIGFNNHMGSLLTEDPEKMSWLMSIAKSRSIFFLDSKTSQSSIAENIANQIGVPTIGRDIFLDHKSNLNSLEKQLERAKFIARKVGQVVLICHPYPETVDFLFANLGELQSEFKLVGISQLVPQYSNATAGKVEISPFLSSSD